MRTQLITGCVIALATAEDGAWTGHDFTDSANNISVVNGVAYGDNFAMQRRITASNMLVGDEIPSISFDPSQSASNPANVQIIMNVFS